LAVSSLVVLWLFSGVGAFALAPRDLFWPLIPSEPPDAQDSLRFAVPAGWDASGTFIGFDRFTADELNRIHQGSKLRPLRFVTAGTPSTRLDTVSVNPIDRFTWGAVALSSSGRCDAILIVYDPAIARFHVPQNYFSVLPTGSACVGSAATPATVTGRTWLAH